MVTLEQVRGKANPATFPRHVLDDCQTGLVLFAAGFHGAQDAIWLTDAGIRATCVDIDGERLWEMMIAYPSRWEFVVGDVFAYTATTKRKWDVVTVDCPTGAFQKCADLIPSWCELANRTVILGSGSVLKFNMPEGWEMTERIQRSDYKGGVYWSVIQKDAP